MEDNQPASPLSPSPSQPSPPPSQPSPPPSQPSHPTHPELSYTTIPLNTPATEIRLLELFPSADFSSPLHCRLYNTPISSPAPFKALSYAWGSDDKTHLIYIDSNDSIDSNDTSNVGATTSVIEVSSPSGDNGGEEKTQTSTTTTTTTTKRCIIRITASLDTCLRHLRAIYHSSSPSPESPSPGTPLALWIDQLCIAQSDSHEKAMQVGLMSQVYSRAEQVLVWLGPVADGSDEVMDAFAELGREFESVGVGLGDAARVDELLAGFCEGGISGGGGGGQKEVGEGGNGDLEKGKEEDEEIGKKIDGGSEKKMGKEVDVTGVGVGTTGGSGQVIDDPGDCIAAGDRGKVGLGVDLQVGVTGTEALDGAAVTCATNEANSSIGKTLAEVVEDGGTRIVRLWASGELQALFRRPWFTRVWVVQEACLCADTVFVCGAKPPVDYDILGAIAICMIYAIREFERKGGYMPDWDGVSTLSTDSEIAGVKMARETVHGLSSLMHLLTQSFSGRHSTTIVGTGLEDENPGTDRDVFRACGPHHSADTVSTTTNEIFGLRGYHVDAIEEVGVVAYQESFSTKPRLHETLEFFENLDRFWELSKEKNDQLIYETPRRREEAIWRVPVGDMVLDWQSLGQHRAKDDFGLEYHKWRRTLKEYQAMGIDMAAPNWMDGMDEDKKDKTRKWVASALGPDGGKHYDGALVYMAKKCLYITKKGYLGMGPSQIQPGDVLVVFPGARIPFVLRPTAEKDTFTYVGDAYCDGIMDGEITFREEKQDFFLV
ncbi:heterokaryon incompatibility protein-domain-containing protein [Sordaria sp. MPI-SDFR-AT-0083]|nr:heterokaryon incompatibility protein-domain-containing protein [Sordaria sp. MPI-SDFR-AT-0083]